MIPNVRILHRIRAGVVLLTGLVLAASALGGCGVTRALIPGGDPAGAPAHGASARPKSARVAKAKPQPKPKAKRSTSVAEARGGRRAAKPDKSGKPADAPPPRSPLAEARAEATTVPAEPYWPYRVAELSPASDSAVIEGALREAVRRDPSYAPALAQLSKRMFESGRHAEAIRLLEGARSQAGTLPPALMAGLALQYDAAGRPDLARRALAALPERDDADAAPVEVYVTLRGPAPDSATALAAAAAIDRPRSAVNQNNYGITRLRAGDPEKARKAFQKAIDLDPALPGPYYNLAILEKYFVFDDAAAAGWFAKYRQLASDDPDGLAEAMGGAKPAELAGTREDR